MSRPREAAVELQNTVNNLLINSVSKSTRTAYSTGFKAFMQFLLLQGLAFDCSVLPDVTENNVLDFVAYCFQTLKLKYGTIKQYLCGIRFEYMIQGVTSPIVNMNFQRLHAAMIGIKRIQGVNRNPKMPITGDILVQLCQSLDKGYFDMYTNALMKAMILLAYFGFLRCGEFTVTNKFAHDENLTLSDIVIYEDHLSILLKQSKTDPFRQGVSLLVFKTGSSLCAYEGIVKYKQIRGKYFPNSLGNNEPFFISVLGKAVTRAFFIEKLKLLVRSLGLDSSKFSRHSLRRGAPTHCALHRIEDHIIQKLGRWSSNCYQSYIDTPKSVIKDTQIAMSKSYKSSLKP